MVVAAAVAAGIDEEAVAERCRRKGADDADDLFSILLVLVVFIACVMAGYDRVLTGRATRVGVACAAAGVAGAWAAAYLFEVSLFRAGLAVIACVGIGVMEGVREINTVVRPSVALRHGAGRRRT